MNSLDNNNTSDIMINEETIEAKPTKMVSSQATSNTRTVTSRHKSAVNQNHDRLYLLLEEIQLEAFWPKLRDHLQITRISHFDYVKEKDLEKIGMSKPAVRRLLDTVNKFKRAEQLKRNTIVPSRPPPPPPSLSYGDSRNTTNASIRFNPDQQARSRLYNNNISKTIKKLNGSRSSSINGLNGSMCGSSGFRSGDSRSSSNNKTESISSSPSIQPSVSFIINPADICVLNNVVLGQGHFGIVKKGIWTTHTREKVHIAVKCLHETLIDSGSNVPEQQQAFADFINEISCMCGLNHQNLIKLYGIVLNTQEPNVGGSMVMMITELAPYGSLLNYLKEKRQQNSLLPIAKLYSYTYQVGYGMSYLESKKLIHRDLAARNILLFTIDQVKICDFGMSRSVKNNTKGQYKMNESQKIPCAWYPPESIRNRVFSTKSDVWMFGVTIWEIFTHGDHPWPNMNVAQILDKIDIERKRLPMPKLCSKHLYSILNECWSPNPLDRPSFHILHQLIKQIKIVEMKAKSEFKKEGKLEIACGDKVVIVDGNATNYWWSGQNMRTLCFGRFPRAILDPMRKLNSDDISMPLKNSFIHTGHMSAGECEKTWGSPGKIDELFLRNPLSPPDLNEPTSDEDERVDEQQPKLYDSPSPSANDVNLINLLESSDDMRVTYPEYSFSMDSFTSSKSKSPSPTTTNSSVSQMIAYKPVGIPSYVNDEKYVFPCAADQAPITNCYYNASTSECLNGLFDAAVKTNSSLPATLPHSSVNLNPTNPFKEDADKLKMSNHQHTPRAITKTTTTSLYEFARANTQTIRSNEKAACVDSNKSGSRSIQMQSSSNLDDYLNKVMNDVLNDLKSPKN